MRSSSSCFLWMSSLAQMRFACVRMVFSDTTSSSVTGVSEEYFSIQGYEVSRGRGLQYSDIATRTKVCVVGAYLDQAYFGGNSVGQTLRVGGQSLTIVGVMEQQSDELDDE